jgi:hypothetical protein
MLLSQAVSFRVVLCVPMLLAIAAPAHAARVAVVVTDPFPLDRYAATGAVGLLVPGAGSTVSREGALAALVRGQVKSALLGGTPSGKVLIRVASRPAPVTIYVSLPPPGPSHNVRRYPIAIVGGGYRGVLVSSATRVDGLVSIADVAPTAVALATGGPPRIASRAGDVAGLRSLDRRLTDAHGARTLARAFVALSLLALFAAAALLRSREIARAGVLLAPLVLGAVLGLSALHEARLAVVLPALAVCVGVALLVARLGDRVGAASVVCFLIAYVVALAVWPEVNSLAVLGPHPDGGGRYYGVTNEVETLLLAPTLVAAAVLGPAAALPALLLMGWSRAGADGGGLLVFAAAVAVLSLRRSGRRVSVRAVVLGAVAVVLAALVVVLADAVTGGSSHVVDAVRSGPPGWADEATHRWRVSWAGATASGAVVAQSLGGLAALVFFGLLRPRVPVVDAFLVAVAVSLVVNDTPQDVLSFGALACGSLLVWARLAPTSRRRETYVFQPRPRSA